MNFISESLNNLFNLFIQILIRFIQTLINSYRMETITVFMSESLNYSLKQFLPTSIQLNSTSMACVCVCVCVCIHTYGIKTKCCNMRILIKAVVGLRWCAAKQMNDSGVT